jgi:mevalonate kinase
MKVKVSDMVDGSDVVKGPVNGSTGPTYVNGDSALAHRLRMERKASSPMAPAFMVSAPGKVIVCGEHSVVHGKV